MPKVAELWDKLPKFMRNNRTVRAEILNNSADLDPYTGDIPWRNEDIDKANMITSKVNIPSANEVHSVILDLDFEAALIPSSTEGHYHLFLDRVMSKESYMKLLQALAEAGIIQWGFYEGAKKRGASSVRLPWIKKGDEAANSLEPDLEKKRIEAAIRFHEDILIKLKAKMLNKDKVADEKGPVQDKLNAIYSPEAIDLNNNLVIKKSEDGLIDPDIEW